MKKTLQSTKSDKLTYRQQNFCRLYVKSPNGTNAALGAGYAASGAHVEASRLLRIPKVKKEIDRLQDQINQRLVGQMVITREDWLAELGKIGFANFADFAKFNANGNLDITETKKLSKNQQAVIAEMGQTVTQHGGSVRIKLHDKEKALVAIGQANGWYVQPGAGETGAPAINVTVNMPSNGRDDNKPALPKAVGW